MTVTLRKWRILTRAKSAPRTQITDRHMIRSAVWLTDHDVLGHVNNARYSEFAAIGVQNLFVRSGTAALMRLNTWAMVTDFEAISFDRMMRFPQHFSLETELKAWRGPFLCFEHVFQTGGKPSARCQMILHLSGSSGPVSVETLLETLGAETRSLPVSASYEALLEDLHTEE